MAFIDPRNSLWSDVINRLHHDFYHLPGYSTLAARSESGHAIAFICEDGKDVAFIPLIVRTVDEADELWDAVSPYGYASPLFNNEASDRFKVFALKTFVEEGRERGLVSTFLRLHPLLLATLPEAEWSAAGAGWTVLTHGPTVALNLTEPHDSWYNRISSNHRRNIRKLLREGYTIRFDFDSDYDRFVEIYHQTMQRRSAADSYLFQRSYFDELHGVLGDRQMFVSVVSPDGMVAAAGIFTITGRIAQYHLGGTDERYLSVAPSKLMFFGARQEAARRGAEILHLGGGLGSRRDALFSFKVGFAGDECMFRSARFIHDRETYEALSRKHLGLTDPSSMLPTTDFFPLYRA